MPSILEPLCVYIQQQSCQSCLFVFLNETWNRTVPTAVSCASCAAGNQTTQVLVNTAFFSEPNWNQTILFFKIPILCITFSCFFKFFSGFLSGASNQMVLFLTANSLYAITLITPGCFCSLSVSFFMPAWLSCHQLRREKITSKVFYPPCGSVGVRLC